MREDAGGQGNGDSGGALGRASYAETGIISLAAPKPHGDQESTINSETEASDPDARGPRLSTNSANSDTPLATFQIEPSTGDDGVVEDDAQGDAQDGQPDVEVTSEVWSGSDQNPRSSYISQTMATVHNLKNVVNQAIRATQGGTQGERRTRSSRASIFRFSWRGQEKHVHFATAAHPLAFRTKQKDELTRSGRCLERTKSIWLFWLDTIEKWWAVYGRPLVVLTSLFELWSMGIWLGFLTEPNMSGDLAYIAIVDIICNLMYIADTCFLRGRLYLEERAMRELLKKNQRHREHAHNKAMRRASTRRVTVQQPIQQQGSNDDLSAPQDGWFKFKTPQCLATEQSRRKFKVHFGLLIAFGMIPVQVLLFRMFEEKEYLAWQVVLVLSFRIGRVIWAFRDCARMINQQELEVYVDIRMHGSSASSWSKARILAKQFTIVMFFGHWLGCTSYTLRKWTAGLQEGIRSNPDNARDYFQKFQDEGMVNYVVGGAFWETYLLTLYKGFNLNYEDLLPEKPIDLMLEVLTSVGILLMKSYCIGSFFKYHQKREMEVSRFSSLMVSVTQYLDLYEVPPSLRKTVINHFRFQQANHRKIKTLEVLGQLPLEIQKKLKELEVLPVVVDRNPTIYGIGISQEYCMKIACMLLPQFLQPSEVIFLEGEVPRELIFLDQGAISFSRGIMQDGRKVEQLIRYVRADRKEDPTLLGGVALILNCAHFFSARVRAGTESVTLMAPRDKIEKLNQMYPEQVDLLIRNVAEAHLLDVQGRDLVGADKTQEHDTEIFESLQLDVRTRLQARQESMNASFTFAAGSGDIKTVKQLLAKRIEANTSDYDKRSALHVAASEGMGEVLEALLHASGHPNVKDRWGGTPLQDALKNGHMAAGKVLRRHQGVLELADPAGELCSCAADGNTIHMQQLLDFGVDPNSGDYDARTALHLSAAEGHLPVVTFLTSRKADVNVKDRWGNAPIEDSIRNGFATVTRHLRACGSQVQSDFAANMLCDAASVGNLSLLQLLFEVGVDTNEGDYDARTACHLAAAEGQVLALGFLLNTARAGHSPLDRWKATPLQDAISSGHELCIQVLMSAGARLGPSATVEAKEKVRLVAGTLGFSRHALTGMCTFSDVTTMLQRRLGSHMAMVEKGRARSDIIDVEAAARFNKQLINKQIGKLRPMGRQVEWIANLLRELVRSAAWTEQLQHLLRDGAAVAAEARFWSEMSHVEHKGSGRGKDARDMIFHRCMLGSMKFAPNLALAAERAAERILDRVRELQSKSAGKTARDEDSSTQASVCTLVAQETLRALGWLSEEDSGLEHIRNAVVQTQGQASLTEVTTNVEALAASVMVSQHILVTLFQSSMQLPDYGQSHPMRHRSLKKGNPAFSRLRRWLEQRTMTILDGYALTGDVAKDEPPRLNSDAASKDVYSSLRLPQGEPQTSPDFTFARMVANELVLLTLTALAVDGWDRWANLSDFERAQHQKHRGSPPEAGPTGLGMAQVLVSREEFMELGRLIKETASACRGVPASDQGDRKMLRKALQKKVRDKETGGRKTAGDDPAESAPSQESMTESLPIRLAKILALREKMSMDELLIMTEMEHDFREQGDGRRKPLFGSITREKFTLNLLRCIINHDEVQKDTMSSVEVKEPPQSTGLEEMAGDPSDYVFPKQDLNKDLLWLYESAGEIQEALSNGGGQSDAEAAEAARVNVSQYQKSGTDGGGGIVSSANNAMDRLRRSMMGAGAGDTWQAGLMAAAFPGSNGGPDSDDDPDDTSRRKDRRSRFTRLCQALCRPITRMFGPEGRRRRRRRRIAKRFRELDDDGDGIGTVEMAQLLAVAFQHTLGQEQEMRYAYRVFELLNKADVGDLVTLPECLEAFPKLEEEIKEAQRKNRRGTQVDSELTSMWAITRALSRLVVPPESSFLQAWDLVRKVVVVYYVLEVPVRFCFLSTDRADRVSMLGSLNLMDSLNLFSDVFMALNMVLTFFRGFVHPTKGVISVFHEIRVQYVFNLFTIDALACCPIDLFVPEIAGDNGLLARPRAALRLVRLLHMRHLLQKDTAKEATAGFFGVAWGMVVIILTVVHFLACGWWYLGTRYDGFQAFEAFNSTYTFSDNQAAGKADGDRGSWTYTYEHRPEEPALADPSGHSPFWWQYLIAFYWSAGRITGQSSPGNMFASSWIELGWICTMFLLNVAVNGYCDGILVDKVIAGDEEAIEAKAMQKIVDEYLQTTELPPELVLDIRTAAQESGKVIERQRMEDIIIALPHTLKQQVARRIFLPLFVNSPVFQACSESFLVEIGAYCRILNVSRDTQLAHMNEPANQLFILNSGRLGLFSSQGNKVAETDVKGEMIGEMPFIFNLKYVVFVTAMEESRLTMLPKQAFDHACKMYPDDTMALRRSITRLIRESSADVDDDDGGKTTGSKRKSEIPGRAKSTLSFATTSSATNSEKSTTVNVALRRLYASDLRQVVTSMREEQAAARQDLICNLIQHAADGNVHKVEAALAKGEVGVDEADYDHRTAVHLAVCNGHLDVVKLLLEEHAASLHLKDRFDHTAMDDAVRERQAAIANYLLQRGAQYQVDADVAAQLCQAAFDNDVPTLQLILTDVGVSPNCSDYDRRTPLHLAASEGHVAVVKLLLDLPDININPRDRLGNTPLDDAMRHGHHKARKLLQQRGASMGDANLGVALCELGFKNDVDKLRDLSDSQVALDECDYDSRTSLHLAASEGHIAAVTFLLKEAKVDPNPLDRFLCTPVDDAERHRHIAVAAFLRSRGGLSGKDPKMASRVAAFKVQKEKEAADRFKENLDKEVSGSAVSTIQDTLQRFRDHPTLEDDIHNFVTHSGNFRENLLKLIWGSDQPSQKEIDLEEEEAQQVMDPSAAHASQTKQYRERLLETSGASMDAAASRILATMESEIIPWITGVSKTQAALLDVFLPGLESTIKRALDCLRGRSRFTRLSRRLWVDSGNKGGSYQCLPVAMLVQQLTEGPLDIIAQARLEASVLLWSAGPLAKPQEELARRACGRSPRSSSRRGKDKKQEEGDRDKTELSEEEREPLTSSALNMVVGYDVSEKQESAKPHLVRARAF